jgi:hypothetical protein
LTYKTSFTTGGLFYHAAPKVARLYLNVRDWDAVRKQMLDSNLLQARTRSSSIRSTRELCFRLEALTDEQLELLAAGDRQEQTQLLWLAACKQYRLVYEFAVEVIREKFLRLDMELAYLDFDIFFNTKAEWDDELAALKNSTREKLRQVLFRMLREADILDPSGRIWPMMLAPRVAQSIASDDPEYAAVFPIFEADFKKQAGI